MKISIAKNLLVFSVVLWALSGCGGSVSTTSKGGNQPVSASVTLESNLTNINSNGSITLSWSTVGATDCVASGDWSGSKSDFGSEIINQLTEDSIFILNCTGDNETVSDSVHVYVGTVVLPTLTFSSSSSTVNTGASTTLSWSTTNATACTASGDWSGSKATSGSEVINSISSDSSFNLSCSGPGGDVYDSLNVTVVSGATPTVSLTASPLSVSYNGNTTLTWNSTNTSSCSASGGWTGSRATSGSVTISNLTADQVFTLSCTGSGGNASESVSVSVQSPPTPTVSLSASPTNVSQGGATSLSWSSTNATSCTASGDWSGTKGTSGSESISSINSDSQYILECTGAGGSASDTVDVIVITTPIPTVSLSASPSTVSEGGSTTLSWISSNATSCSATGDWSGTKGTSGSETINSINNDSQFVLSCTGAGGSSSASVNVSVVINHTGSVLLSWTPPTENTDGSSLTDLAGYRIYYGIESGRYSESIQIANPGLSSYLIENLASTSWYFVMTSYNSDNIESSYSPEVIRIIN